MNKAYYFTQEIEKRFDYRVDDQFNSILKNHYKRVYMKKVVLAFLMLAGFVSSASAHHMAVYEDAGIYIPEDSPHLDMEF